MLQKERILQAPIKLAQPFPAPESRTKNFMDTRIFLKLLTSQVWNNHAWELPKKGGMGRSGKVVEGMPLQPNSLLFFLLGGGGANSWPWLPQCRCRYHLLFSRFYIQDCDFLLQGPRTLELMFRLLERFLKGPRRRFDGVLNGQSTVGGPKWTKMDLGQNGPKWTILVHFGLASAEFQFGIRPFWPKRWFGPFWSSTLSDSTAAIP